MKLMKVSNKIKGTYLEQLIMCYNYHIINNDKDYLTMKSLKKEIAVLRKEIK